MGSPWWEREVKLNVGGYLVLFGHKYFSLRIA